MRIIDTIEREKQQRSYDIMTHWTSGVKPALTPRNGDNYLPNTATLPKMPNVFRAGLKDMRSKKKGGQTCRYMEDIGFPRRARRRGYETARQPWRG